MFKLLLITSAIFLAITAFPVDSQAHIVTKQACYKAAKYAGPYQSKPWRAAFKKCQKYRKDHAWQHKCGKSVKATIRCVFKAHGEAAISVAKCESGLSTTARNGQFYGIFQMGENERATYGDGSTALAQSQAAHKYFIASGSDWSPWQCKP